MFYFSKNANRFLALFILAFSVWMMFGCSGSKEVAQTPVAEPEEPIVTQAPEPPPANNTEETKPVETAPAVTFVLQNVYFELDRYDLTSEALQTLADNARVLQAHSDATIVIEGHCDERGTVEYNLALGDKRAKAARDYVISLGVSPSQITTISYGKERPVDAAHNEEAWAKNRRAEFARR